MKGYVIEIYDCFFFSLFEIIKNKNCLKNKNDMCLCNIVDLF